MRAFRLLRRIPHPGNNRLVGRSGCWAFSRGIIASLKRWEGMYFALERIQSLFPLKDVACRMCLMSGSVCNSFNTSTMNAGGSFFRPLV